MRRREPLVGPPAGTRVAVTRIGGEELVVFAFPTRSSPLDDAPGLTDAERAVGAMLVEGCSDAEIASARGTSLRTVAKQVASLYRKLGVSSRRELWALCHAPR